MSTTSSALMEMEIPLCCRNITYESCESFWRESCEVLPVQENMAAVGKLSRHMARKRVVFPLPFGPRSATICPGFSTERERWFRI